MRPQPRLVALVERKVRFRRVDDLSAGIDPGLGRIRLDQYLREAVDRGADDLVESILRSIKIGSLLSRYLPRERDLEIIWNFPAGKGVYEPLDADLQFAGRKFGEGDRRYVLRVNPRGEQHGDATRNYRGLAGAGSGLDKERAPGVGEGSEACLMVWESIVLHHAASQILIASPSRASACARLRTR